MCGTSKQEFVKPQGHIFVTIQDNITCIASAVSCLVSVWVTGSFLIWKNFWVTSGLTVTHNLRVTQVLNKYYITVFIHFAINEFCSNIVKFCNNVVIVISHLIERIESHGNEPLSVYSPAWWLLTERVSESSLIWSVCYLDLCDNYDYTCILYTW